MNFELVSILVFLGFIAVLIFKDRKNIEFDKGLFIRRSTKGKEVLYKFAAKYEKPLRIIGNIGIAVAFIASIYGVYLLASSTYAILSNPEEMVRPLKLVLPALTGAKLPGFILGVPFWYWIIAVFLVMGIHEPMHAFMARIEKVEIKSFGVLLLIVLPGAFVDPDEKQLKKLSTIKKLRVFAAGSFGNMILAGIVLLLLLGFNFVLGKAIQPIGVSFENVIAGTDAETVRLKGRIIQINGTEVKDLNGLAEIMANVTPNDTVDVMTTSGYYRIRTSSDPDNSSRALIGINISKTDFVYAGSLASLGQVPETTLSILDWIYGMFSWVFVLNLGVGAFNLFPLKPLDGGLMMEEIATRFFKKRKGRIIANFVSIIVLIIVLFNLFGPSIIGWFS